MQVPIFGDKRTLRCLTAQKGTRNGDGHTKQGTYRGGEEFDGLWGIGIY